MTNLSEADALRYEYNAPNSSPIDAPTRVVFRGENWWLLPPAVTTGTYVMRTHYMVRPSRICGPQAAGAGSITGINSVSRLLSLSSGVASVAEDGSVTGVVTGGTAAVDIIRVGGWHKVQWTGFATFSSATSCTLSTDPSGLVEANDLSDIALGDVMRFSDQTDWAPLPADFHRSLADATAAKILTARGMADRAAELSQTLVVPDLQRFGDLLRPRDGSAAFVFVAPEFA